MARVKNRNDISSTSRASLSTVISIKENAALMAEHEPIKIMIVEDEENHNELITFLLTKAGYDVVSFDRAKEALNYLKKNNVDMIISDIMMPEMDGLEFCGAVRQDYNDIYFILLTARGEIDDKVAGLSVGADEYIVKPFDITEFSARVKAGERIVRSKKQLAFLTEALTRLADTDSLTKVKNRRYFQESLSHEIMRSNRYDHTLALLMIDIDYFKKFNDTYGHLAGDFVLKKVAQLITRTVRKTDIVCRYGGEEFAILLPETSAAKAFYTAEKIRKAFESRHFEFEGNKLSVTISVGVAIKTPNVSVSSEQLVAMADKALYRSKQEGRNKTFVSEKLR